MARSRKRSSKRRTSKRRTSKRQGSKRASFNRKKRSDREMIVINPGFKRIAPSKCYVKFKTMLRGYFTGTGGGTTSTQFQTSANRPVAPFNTGVITSVGSAGTNTTIMSGYNVSVSPVGMNNYLGAVTAPNANVGMYGMYQVLHATSKFTVLPQTIQDSIAIGVDIFNLNKANDTPTNFANLELKPWSKTALVNSSGSNRGRNSVKISVPIAKYLGLRPREYEALAYANVANSTQGAFSGSLSVAPLTVLNFMYMLQSPDNAIFSNDIEFCIENVYYVRFSQPNDNNLPVVL